MTSETHDGLPFRQKVLVIVVVVAGVLLVDLVTKALAESILASRPTYHLLGDTVRIGYALNAGVFLSLGHDLSPQLRFWLFVVGVGGVLAMLLGLTLKDERFRLQEVVAVAAIVGGGIGNLCDRVALGVVRDFLNVGIGSLRTGIFNVADMAITFGGVALLILPFLTRRSRKEP